MGMPRKSDVIKPDNVVFLRSEGRELQNTSKTILRKGCVYYVCSNEFYP